MKARVEDAHHSDVKLKEMCLQIKKERIDEFSSSFDCYSEVEINTLEELLKLKEKAGHDLIISTDNTDYDFEIMIYNDYIE